MSDPFSPNRFIHEVEHSSSTAVRQTAARNPKLRAQGGRRAGNDGDGFSARDSDRGSMSSHALPVPWAVPQPNLPTARAARLANPDHPSRSLTPRSIAVVSGVFISVLVFCVIYSSDLLSPPRPLGLDPVVKAYVDCAINRALRDPVGRRDFALLADGAIVLPELTKLVTSKGPVDLPSNSYPEAALTDDMRIGSCWLVSGSTVQLGLRLSAMIHPTHVSIDHIPFEIAADIGRAPHSMLLWGGVDGETNKARLRNLEELRRVTARKVRGRPGPKVTRGYDFALLGSVEYDIRASSHVQTFALEPYFAESGMYFGVVVLEVTSNWGSNSTCIYRLRVHGDTYAPEQ